LTFFLRSLILRSLVGLMAFSLVLAFTAGVSVLAGWCRWEQYGKLVPLLTLYGGMVWMIPMLLSRKESEAKNGEIAEEGEITETEKQEILDRISVKKGSEIHIIKVGELRYIQADGDYVHLFTDDAKYLKEQTMKYFETRLPDNFVRIHRSCIVNVDEITRVELFGKESYNVKIRNGVTLKASVAGYKSLKNRLCL
jgi:Response regulator of the LytR/AlgR family